GFIRQRQGGRERQRDGGPFPKRHALAEYQDRQRDGDERVKAAEGGDDRRLALVAVRGQQGQVAQSVQRPERRHQRPRFDRQRPNDGPGRQNDGGDRHEREQEPTGGQLGRDVVRRELL